MHFLQMTVWIGDLVAHRSIWKVRALLAFFALLVLMWTAQATTFCFVHFEFFWCLEYASFSLSLSLCPLWWVVKNICFHHPFCSNVYRVRNGMKSLECMFSRDASFFDTIFFLDMWKHGSTYCQPTWVIVFQRYPYTSIKRLLLMLLLKAQTSYVNI